MCGHSCWNLTPAAEGIALTHRSVSADLLAGLQFLSPVHSTVNHEGDSVLMISQNLVVLLFSNNSKVSRTSLRNIQVRGVGRNVIVTVYLVKIPGTGDKTQLTLTSYTNHTHPGRIECDKRVFGLIPALIIAEKRS